MNEAQQRALAQSIGEFMEVLKRGTDAQAFDVLTRNDLTLTQLRVVMLLADTDDPKPISEIADELRLSLATAGRAVDYLVQHDFARRWEDPEDRRSKLVCLTEAGLALTEAPRAAMMDRIHTFAGSLQPEAAANLLGALRQVLDDPPSAEEASVHRTRKHRHVRDKPRAPQATNTHPTQSEGTS